MQAVWYKTLYLTNYKILAKKIQKTHLFIIFWLVKWHQILNSIHFLYVDGSNCICLVLIKSFYITWLLFILLIGGCRGSDCMVVGFITTYIAYKYLSPLTLWVQISLRWSVLDTTLCDKVCQWLATGRRFSPGTLLSSTN